MEMTEEQKRIEKQKELKQKKQIEEWTGLKYAETIFDSDVDNWSMNTSVLEVGFDGKKASNRASNFENFSIEFSNFP